MGDESLQRTNTRAVNKHGANSEKIKLGFTGDVNDESLKLESTRTKFTRDDESFCDDNDTWKVDITRGDGDTWKVDITNGGSDTWKVGGTNELNSINHSQLMAGAMQHDHNSSTMAQIEVNNLQSDDGTWKVGITSGDSDTWKVDITNGDSDTWKVGGTNELISINHSQLMAGTMQHGHNSSTMAQIEANNLQSDDDTWKVGITSGDDGTWKAGSTSMDNERLKHAM
jgi:hypothetical protein